MTENEAIKELETSIDLAQMCTQNYERKNEIQGYEMAIKALEEVQQYRAIGTVEELETASKYLRLVKMCGTVGKVIEECVEYEEIGTPEECRAAAEQQIPKRPTLCKSDEQTTRYTADYRCPKCNGMFTGTGIANYCYHCGQRLDWEE